MVAQPPLEILVRSRAECYPSAPVRLQPRTHRGEPAAARALSGAHREEAGIEV